MAVLLVKDVEIKIDDADLELVSRYKWRKSTNGRPITNVKIDGKKKTKLIHQVIVGDIFGMVIDHINGDFRDNRRSNLRHVTLQQNQWNKKCGKLSHTGIKGVGFCKQTKKWRVSMRIDGSYKTIGRYDCIGIAMKKYSECAKKYHGEYARVNIGVP